jgi:hypothetical protein
MERKRWAEAEAAFDEAVAARPFDDAILLERARFLAAHPPGWKADDDFTRAYILGNREPALLATISSSGSLFHRVVAESAGSAAQLWAGTGESLAKRQIWTEAIELIVQVVRRLLGRVARVRCERDHEFGQLQAYRIAVGASHNDIRGESVPVSLA